MYSIKDHEKPVQVQESPLDCNMGHKNGTSEDLVQRALETLLLQSVKQLVDQLELFPFLAGSHQKRVVQGLSHLQREIKNVLAKRN